jgi:hypothetical protein
MENYEAAKQGASVFQIVINDRPGNIVADFNTALRQIGYNLAGSHEAFQSWGRFSEFPGQETAELAGSLFHRIRYAMLEQKDTFKLHQHHLTSMFGSNSLVRVIDLSNEFDPGFEFQTALNYCARGMESAPTAAAKIEAILMSQIDFARRSNPDETIVAHIKEVQQRMGGKDFVGMYEPPATEFLDWLPTVARSEFDRLAVEMQPAATMII